MDYLYTTTALADHELVLFVDHAYRDTILYESQSTDKTNRACTDLFDYTSDWSELTNWIGSYDKDIR